jgi:hypothetical protein
MLVYVYKTMQKVSVNIGKISIQFQLQCYLNAQECDASGDAHSICCPAKNANFLTLGYTLNWVLKLYSLALSLERLKPTRS